MPGWSFPEYVLLALLLPLLAASAFLNGSETALFGLSEREKHQLRRRNTISNRAIEALLAEPRMLLITVLGANMTVSTLYFVISSVLLMHTKLHLAVDIAFAILTLLLVVLFSEVLPKLYANAHRITFAQWCAPWLLVVHRVSTPLRLVIDSVVVSPLSRLTAPTVLPPGLDAAELAELLDVTRHEGVIDLDEQIVMRDVIRMGRTQVRAIMTPRVHMKALPADATRAAAIAMLRQTRAAHVPLYSGSLDRIVGVLDAMALLREENEARGAATSSPRKRANRMKQRLPDRAVLRPEFVPELATVDHLLERLRQRGAPAAIVVDEYGGTAGFVTRDHIIEQIARVPPDLDAHPNHGQEGAAS